MLRALDLGYKEGRKSIISNRRDFTGLANKSMSRTKPTDAQKHMFDSTSLTSDSQETPQTTPSPQTTPLLQATMATTLYMLMLLLSTLRSLMFKGANVTKFLKRYEDLCLDYQVLDNNKLTRLSRYCIQPIAETIKLLKEQKSYNYTTLKKALCTKYQNDDTQQLLYLVLFLENYKNIACTKKDDILDYCHKFN